MDSHRNYLSDIIARIRTQNRRDLLSLLKNPTFFELQGPEIDDILLYPLPVLFDSEILALFIQHPALELFNASSLTHLLLMALRVGNENVIDQLLEHPHIDRLSEEQTQIIVAATLEFENLERVTQLQFSSNFIDAFDKNLSAMVLSAVRNQDPQWLKKILLNPKYPHQSTSSLIHALRWSIEQKNRELIKLILKKHNLPLAIESKLVELLRSEQLNEELTDPFKVMLFVAQALLEHSDASRFSPVLLSWIAEQVILKDPSIFHQKIIQHPAYKELSPDTLADLILLCLPKKRHPMLSDLIRHPHYQQIGGDKLGLILENAMNQVELEHISTFIHHPRFNEVPSDSIKRIVLKNPLLASQLLKDENFGQQCQKMLFELIRRNDNESLAPMLTPLAFKHEVVNQLEDYCEEDPVYINLFGVRDIIRQIFLTKDPSLIREIIKNPLFNDRVEELMVQALQFDDDPLIESMLQDHLLRDLIKQKLRSLTPREKKHIQQLFISSPQFQMKSESLKNEILSII